MSEIHSLGHLTSETEKCAAFVEDPDVITIRSPQYVLCNFYPSPRKVFETEFASSEHAYQWRFIKHVGEDDLAREVIESSSPTEAKAIASRVPRHLHQNWHSIKLCVMKDILHAKADYCDKFKEELLNNGRKRLVEAVRGIYFGLLDFHHALPSPPNPTFTLVPINLAMCWNR